MIRIQSDSRSYLEREPQFTFFFSTRLIFLTLFNPVRSEIADGLSWRILVAEKVSTRAHEVHYEGVTLWISKNC